MAVLSVVALVVAPVSFLAAMLYSGGSAGWAWFAFIVWIVVLGLGLAGLDTFRQYLRHNKFD